ncbi:hypothetical protein I4U23_015100 [Adineta vaga]|nr:hypothetical protein I4U23_015100 [Adineta vaga]
MGTSINIDYSYFWALHEISTLISMNILPPTNFCAVDNDAYRSYISICGVVYQFAISISIMVIFG